MVSYWCRRTRTSSPCCKFDYFGRRSGFVVSSRGSKIYTRLIYIGLKVSNERNVALLKSSVAENKRNIINNYDGSRHQRPDLA